MASSASFINVKISDILLGTYSEMLQYKDYIVIATSPVLRTPVQYFAFDTSPRMLNSIEFQEK